MSNGNIRLELVFIVDMPWIWYLNQFYHMFPDLNKQHNSKVLGLTVPDINERPASF